MELKQKRILIFCGLRDLGQKISLEFKKRGFENLFTIAQENVDHKSLKEVDCALENFHADIVFNAAGPVGGIAYNDGHPFDLMRDNLLFDTNILSACVAREINCLVNLSSSCVYPAEFTRPHREEGIGVGELEPVSQFYSTAKISTLKMIDACRKQFSKNYFSIIPATLYSDFANPGGGSAHVLNGLFARLAKAQKKHEETFEVWGSGNPRREFLHVEDLCSAIELLVGLALIGKLEESVFNVGEGADYSVKELANLVASVSNFKGRLVFNSERPDGVFRKLLDSSRIRKLGWSPNHSLGGTLASITFETPTNESIV